ncbi:potassium channel family protein [Microbacterium sp. bgisy207]|jgi:voltage-gated potassium channel|uniref:potassium channel family protein n=1 Tax=Microbacterium sp. bgisy207 TaxID=3413800 RepID=UPI003EB6E71D
MTEERWQKLTYWPLVVASLAFIAAYSWQVIANLQGPEYATMRLVMAVTWVMFAIDYLVRLGLTPKKGAWFRAHLFDLAVVVLPVLKPLRLIRAITEIQKMSRGDQLRTQAAVLAGGTVAILIWICSLAVLEAERPAPGANILNFGDAIWWAFVTVTTVGYGDLYPITAWGRIVAVVLMSVGIGVVGVVTATTASWFVERAATLSGNDDQEAATRGQVRELSRQLEAAVKGLPKGADESSPRQTRADPPPASS